MNTTTTMLTALATAASLAAQGATLFFAGDSTLDEHGGDESTYASWGSSLRPFLRDGNAIVNYGRGGRSTASFLREGWWDKITGALQPGDFVVIQFGHNDQKLDKPDVATPIPQYKENLRRMAADVREKGATPVFATSIVRLTYGKNGLLFDSANLDDWAEAMRETAAELGVDLVDMRVLTRKAANEAGEAEALTWHAPGDRTHPAVKGARLYAQLFLADVARRGLAIAGLFVDGAAGVDARTKRGIAYADRPNCLLDLRYPGGETNFPTVVWFHGGGLTGGRRHFLTLSDAGIAQVAVGYRLLGKDATRGEDCIEDAAAAVAWTLAHIAEYGGDPSKVFVAGHSAGAYLTMMVGMDPKWLAAHGVKNTDIAGLVPISGQATTHFNVRTFSGDEAPRLLPKIDGLAPLAHASKDCPPIVAVCGEPPYEMKARAEENRLLIATCAALGHPFARYVELPLCDHVRVSAAARPYLEMLVRGKLP